MNFYNQQHQFTCGIDLHARSMYVCMLDAKGKTVVHKDLPADPEPLPESIAPCRQDLVVGVECVLCW